MNVIDFFRNREAKGEFGIEIEAEGKRLFKAPTPLWRVEHDGSLRGADNAEYVLKKPVDIKMVPVAIDQLNKHMAKADSVVDMSRRTSTHVHVNCQDLSMMELANFITLLVTVEELLVDWCGEDRASNLFCLQSKDAEEMIATTVRFFNSLNHILLGDGIRYSAINLASLYKYGSVELRCLYGTVDKEIITTWVGVLKNIKEAAKTYDNPIDIIREMSIGVPSKFVKKTMGNYYGSFYVGNGRAQKVLDGVRRAQDIAFLVDWDEFKNTIKKKEEAIAKRNKMRMEIEPGVVHVNLEGVDDRIMDMVAEYIPPPAPPQPVRKVRKMKVRDGWAVEPF